MKAIFIGLFLVALGSSVPATEWLAFADRERLAHACECGDDCRCSPCFCAADRFATYREIYIAAMRRGGYAPGQRVVISVGATEDVNRTWQSVAHERGWIFCVHDTPQPGLPLGLSHHQADAMGVLRPVLSSEPTVSSRVVDAFDCVGTAPCAKGACVGGVCQ